MLIGVNFGVSWPGFNALIASVVDGEVRQQYFGVNFALVNLGIGVGGIIGGFFVDVTEPSTFTTIFLIDAATSLIPLALLLGPLRHVRTQAEPDPAVTTEGGYREILRRPAVLWMTLLTFFSVFIGYGQIEAGFPAYARQIAQVSTAVVGISFAVNTAVIVLLQFAVLRLINGRRRTRVMQVMALIWAVSWVMLGAAGLLPDSVTAAIAVIAFMGVFAFGETMMQPTIPAIYNDLATDRTRGRYNALNSAAFQGGAILGPLVAGCSSASASAGGSSRSWWRAVSPSACWRWCWSGCSRKRPTAASRSIERTRSSGRRRSRLRAWPSNRSSSVSTGSRVGGRPAC